MAGFTGVRKAPAAPSLVDGSFSPVAEHPDAIHTRAGLVVDRSTPHRIGIERFGASGDIHEMLMFYEEAAGVGIAKVPARD
jgi:hypothetical protein